MLMTENAPIEGEATTRSLYEYWRSIKGGNIVPHRSDFRPANVQSLLPYLMILEYRDPEALIFRLSGTGCYQKLGFDLTGKDGFDLVADRERDGAKLHFNALRSYPCGSIVYIKMQSKYQTHFIAETIFLPMRDYNGNVSQLIGLCSVVERDVKKTWTSQSEIMKTISVCFLDIGAGAPAPPPHQTQADKAPVIIP